MASPTTQHPAPPTQQAATPGVGMQGAPPHTAALEAAKPVLFEDIDPVLLMRLYPDSKSGDDARAQAIAAGDACHEQGAKLVASQQEPVAGAQPGEPPPSAPPPAGGGWRPPPLQTSR